MFNFKKSALTLAILTSGIMSLSFTANATEEAQASNEIEVI